MMRVLEGKAAFVTGGASGIGLALARAFAEARMKVMLADIEESALDAALAELRGTGTEVRAVVCDVADRAAMARAANETFATFGKVHVLCSNAGVAAGGQMDLVSLGDWEWIIGVNVMGFVYGIEAFLPHIRAHGEGGHIVNTASITGMVVVPGTGPYNATKAALIALSETLAAELVGTEIGVSVLIPSFVRTRIAESERTRAPRFGSRRELPPSVKAQLATLVRGGIDPKEVALRVMTAIRDNDLYVFTHPEIRGEIEERFRLILAAFDKSAPEPA
jgi:NAD(P)-dependent dehydrogenase (short-subunit alcohol dehydrogenase family)